MPFESVARPTVRALASSKIRAVANAGMGVDGVLPFWFGEPDQVTPEFIRRAAIASLEAGETFYSQNLGLPALREALATYLGALHGAVEPGHIAVTNSGVNALQLCHQALLEPGDRVVAVTPLWPNLVEAPKILSARVHAVPLDFDAARGWHLDLDRLIDALTRETRVLIVNSPNNPSGWTMDRDAQRTVLEHCRRHGIWILADDAYERLVFGAEPGAIAPSFLDIADREERVVSANTFSKSWLMTGWRLGWIVAPRKLMDDLGTLIEYNTSCAPVFVQRAGIAAVTGGDQVTRDFAQRLAASRDFLCDALATLPGVEVAPPAGAMYAFFRIRGMTDSLAFCQRLVREFRLGLAPGSAFGPEGEGCVRWCFAGGRDALAEGVNRLRQALESR
jgi:aspartate/methionine/tyrosine aminotransferase